MRDIEITRLLLNAERRRRAAEAGSTWGMLAGVPLAFVLVTGLAPFAGDSSIQPFISVTAFFATILASALAGRALARARYDARLA